MNFLQEEQFGQELNAKMNALKTIKKQKQLEPLNSHQVKVRGYSLMGNWFTDLLKSLLFDRTIT